MSKFNQTIFKLTALSLALLSLNQVSFAADVKSGSKVLVNVNGVAIPSVLLENNVKLNVGQGQKDTPELRNALKEELISRELVSQDAQKKGLDKTDEAKDQFAQIRQNFLIELALTDYLKKNPITEAEMKAEYDRQIALLGEPGTINEYQLSQIATATKADALAALARVQKGESFDKVAKEVSINPSKENGGNLGWVLPGQVLPSIGSAIVKLAKGAVTEEPIETPSGWNLLKVEGVRKYTPPTLEQSKEQLQIAVLQNKKTSYFKKLRDAAKLN